MEELCKELDDVKVQLEKLTVENRIKTEQSESLRKAHSEQLMKIKEAKLEIEKQVQELIAKEEELSIIKQTNEEFKSKLYEKESALRHLGSTNDKLRADWGEKLQKLELANRELVFALDKAEMKNKEQEQEIRMSKEEIHGLKGLLSNAQKKCSEAERKAQVPKELRQRDDHLMKLEEEKMKIKDQLKWKKEQFEHLEQAHEKVQEQFWTSKKEWERENARLIEEICLLQTNLDSQTRVSESLRNQLHMCNHALAQEESRRKLLELQISESKKCYENVFTEYQEARTKTESLTARRDEEIAALRHLLSTKETHFKETEFRRRHLEQENQGLLKSLKELQEAQIQEAGSASSLKKLRNKLRNLEQMHKECSANFRAQEVEWDLQMEEVTGDLKHCRLELDDKDKQILKLHMELEGCHSSIMQLKLENEELRAQEVELDLQMEEVTGNLKRCRLELDDKDKQILRLHMELEGCHSSIMQLMLENEEISVMLMVLKSGVSESHSRLSDSKLEMELHKKEAVEKIDLLMEQLEQKNTALLKAHAEIKLECEKTESLLWKIESADHIEQEHCLMQKELERYKETLKELSGQQLRFKEKSLKRENALKDDLRKVSDALDIANTELAEKTIEGNEIEFELESWKSFAERLKSCLDENQEMRREMEASLLSQIEAEQNLKQELESILKVAEEKGKRADDLQQQIVLLEQELSGSKTEATLARKKIQSNFEKEKRNLLQTVEVKEKRIEDLQKQISWMEQEFMTRELEAVILTQIEAEKTLDWVKERLLQVVEEKNFTIEELQLKCSSVEQNTTSSVKISAFSQSALDEKQAEIDALHEAWKKITAAVVLNELEIQENKLIIIELEEEITNLWQNQELQEKSLSCSYIQEERLRAALEAKKLEMDETTVQLQNKLKILECLIEKLNSEKGLLSADVKKLSLEREELLSHEERLRAALEATQLEMDETMLQLQDKLKTSEGLIEKFNSEKSLLSADAKKLSLEREELLSQEEHLRAALEAKQLEMDETMVQLQDKLRTSEGLIEKLNSEKGLVSADVKKLSLEREELLSQEERLQAALEAQQLEMDETMVQLQNKLRASEGLIEKLNSEKGLLSADVKKLKLEREELLANIGGLYDQICEFSNADAELMGRVGRIVQGFDEGTMPLTELEEYDELCDIENMNADTVISSLAKKLESNADGRLPLKERNN